MRLFVAALLPALLAAGEAAPVADPTADEMAVVVLANRHRAERATVNNRIAEMIRTKQVSGSPAQWSHAAKGSPNLPPLVVSPALMSAARALLKDGAKPPDKEHFDATPAVKAAGYASDKPTLALFAPERPGALNAYATAVLNVVGAKAVGNQKFDEYAGLESMTPAWREIGVAAAPAGKGRLNVVIILGQGGPKRCIGGTVFVDADHDLAYDVGEGKAGITVTCGAASTTTGASGAWWLALDGEAEAKVVFSGAGFTAERPVAKGKDNVGIDWRLPNPADIKTADKLIADAEKAAKIAELDKKRVPLAALLVGTRMAALDDARQQRVATLVEPLLGEYDLLMGKILGALGEEPADFKKTLSDAQKPWGSAMPAWFKEADAMAKLRQQVNKVLAAPEAQQGKLAPPVIKQVQKAKAETCDPKFLEQYSTWEEQLEDTLPAEAAPAAPKKK